MRNRTPKLILQGNQRQAKKWIPWATKALDRIKNLTVEGLADKVLRPVTGVAVHVRSVNDIDFIRIAVALKGKCDLTGTLTPLGGKSVNFLYNYRFDDNSASQALWIDTGGLFLSGNLRYSPHSVNNGIVNTNKLFLNTGDYTISTFAHGDVFDQVFHDSGVINQPTYQVIMDVSSIAPKAALQIEEMVSSSPYDCYANGFLLGRLFGTEYRRRIFSITVDVVDTMTMDFVAVSGNIGQVQIRFRQYKCLGTDSQNITVT